MPYERVQWGWTWLVYVLVAVPFTVFMFAVADEGEGETVVIWTAVFLIALLIILVIFSRLEVRSDTQVVVTSFGFGWPSKTVELSEVAQVRAVRNQWYYGWGVRKLTNGWMYNVWGLDAVELEFQDGTAFRIGTDDPQALEAALQLSVRS